MRARGTGNSASSPGRRTYPVAVASRRDVAVVLSGGGINGVLMELGFPEARAGEPALARGSASSSGPRRERWCGCDGGTRPPGRARGVHAGAPAGPDVLARTGSGVFRSSICTSTPCPRRSRGWFARLDGIAEQLVRASPIELVVLRDRSSPTITSRPESGYELVYSARTTTASDPRAARSSPPAAVVRRSCCRSRVGDRVRDGRGRGSRNFPLGHAYDRPDARADRRVRYLPADPRMDDRCAPSRSSGGCSASAGSRRSARSSPSWEEAEARAERGEPAHLADLIVRLARVAILRNTELEERVAEERDASLHGLGSLREDVLALVSGDDALRQAVARRFAAGTFPVPR